MKITHLCLAGMISDGFSYQENNLIKWHKKLGFDVSVVTSEWVYVDGNSIVKHHQNDYYTSDNVHVLRLPIKNIDRISNRFKRYERVIESLDNLSPDILFIHALQFLDILKIAKYAKTHPQLRIIIDNHADYSNSARNIVSKVINRTVWRYCAKKINPYVEVFYGVMPSRVDFLKNEYVLPPEKCRLLLMGADDDLVAIASAGESIRNIRESNDIDPNDFLIITGGKIDCAKGQIVNLLEAVCELQMDNVKLIIFGSIAPELKDKVMKYIDNKRIKYVGWLTNEETYRHIAASNLAVYPGRHSVLWEQTVAQGIPIVCKCWDGTNHIDINGNVRFLIEDTVGEMKRTLLDVINNSYTGMYEAANSSARSKFLYSNIAEDSIKEHN